MRNFPEQIFGSKRLSPNFLSFLGFCFEVRSNFGRNAFIQEVILNALHFEPACEIEEGLIKRNQILQDS